MAGLCLSEVFFVTCVCVCSAGMCVCGRVGGWVCMQFSALGFLWLPWHVCMCVHLGTFVSVLLCVTGPVCVCARACRVAVGLLACLCVCPSVLCSVPAAAAQGPWTPLVPHSSRPFLLCATKNICVFHDS